jgi:hypothetical protein
MRDLLILAIHLLVTLAKLLRPGGARAVAAESLLLKQQPLIINLWVANSKATPQQASRTSLDSVASRRTRRAEHERGQSAMSVEPESHHQGSDEPGDRCSNPERRLVCARDRRRSRRIADPDTRVGQYRSVARQMDAKPEQTEPT